MIDGMAESQTFQVPALNGSNPTTQVAFGFTSFEGPSPSLGIYFDNVVVDIF